MFKIQTWITRNIMFLFTVHFQLIITSELTIVDYTILSVWAVSYLLPFFRHSDLETGATTESGGSRLRAYFIWAILQCSSDRRTNAGLQREQLLWERLLCLSQSITGCKERFKLLACCHVNTNQRMKHCKETNVRITTGLYLMCLKCLIVQVFYEAAANRCS